MNTFTKASSTAPYASVKPFSDILNRIRQLQLKSIDTDTLKKWGYKGFDASSAISALKFLNLIDSDGHTTGDYVSIKSDIKYRPELKRIVAQAYDRLFAIFSNDLSSVTRKDIIDTIILEDAYPKTSKQTAGKAAGLFIWLCNEAAIEIAEKQSLEPVKTAMRPKAKLVQTNGQRLNASSPLGVGQSINLNLNLSPDMTEEDVYQYLRRIRSAVQRLNHDAAKQ